MAWFCSLGIYARACHGIFRENDFPWRYDVSKFEDCRNFRSVHFGFSPWIFSVAVNLQWCAAWVVTTRHCRMWVDVHAPSDINRGKVTGSWSLAHRCNFFTLFSCSIRLINLLIVFSGQNWLYCSGGTMKNKVALKIWKFKVGAFWNRPTKIFEIGNFQKILTIQQKTDGSQTQMVKSSNWLRKNTVIIPDMLVVKEGL